MKDILNKNFKNVPSSRYYRFKITDKKEKIKKIKIFSFWFFILIIFIFFVWLILLSPVFNIHLINIADNNYLSSDNIKNIISKIAPFGLQKNLLILPNQPLKKEIAAAFPAITDITIKKEFFHTLTIDFKKRIALGIWCNNISCYFFDKDGIAFAEAPQTEGGLILKIEDKSQNSISFGDKILSYNQIKFLMSFSNKINENDKLKILEFKIKPNSSVNLEAITNKNWSIYLDENQDPVMATNNLLTILKEAVKHINNLEYIDLRIPSRIFYKLK